jgi:NAD(P)-dependent dehydrogenase (short-subunit alcohol dehydrogenase family)
VSLIARDPAKLALAREAVGGVTFTAVADVAVEAHVTEAIRAAEQAHGPVDVLMTSAGVAEPGYFADLPTAAFQRAMAVNYFGTLYALKAVVPAMRQRGRGAVVLLRGPASGSVAEIDADLGLTGVTETGAAGAALASGGDVNGDGRADLLVGAPGMEDGTAYLLEGLAAGPLDEVAVASLVAVRSFDDAGAGVAILGDIDADGFADIGVGAPQVGTASGAVYVVFGPVRGEFGLTDADIVITTAYDEDELGRVFTGVGDLDGDGRDDFALGSPLHSEGGNDTGAAWLFLAAPI